MHQSIVLVSGSALRIYADDLRRLMAKGPQIREHLLQYIEALMIHGSQTALCGVRHELEQRLACWLCVAYDALEGNVLPITHDRRRLFGQNPQDSRSMASRKPMTTYRR
jgi:hypothetical protein